jgi:hypothetical protein
MMDIENSCLKAKNMSGIKQPTLPPIDDETRAHQARTAAIRFKQNMVHGVGAASVFGVAAASTSALFQVAMGADIVAKIATASAVTLGVAWGGIAALVVLGIGCLYLSSKYTSQLVNLEQTRHASQIAKGINGVGQGMDKPIAFPAQSHVQSVAQVTEAPIAKPISDLATNKPTLVVDNVTNLGRAANPVFETARGQA